MLIAPQIQYELLDQLPDAIIGVGADGAVLSWSKGAETMFGYARNAAVGRRLEDLIVPSERLDEARRLLQATLAGGLHICETVRRKRDGTLIHVAVTGKKMLGAEAGAAFALFAEKDVNHLKVMRTSRLLDTRLGNLLESMPDAIVIANAAGRIVLANTQAETLFGYARGALTGELVEVLQPERLRAAHVAHRSAYLEQPRTRSMGVGLDPHGRRADGTEFPIEVSLSPIQTDEDTLVMSAIRDITDRKRFEIELRQSEQRFRDIAEVSGDWIWETGPDHRLVFIAVDRVDPPPTPVESVLGKTRWELAGVDPETDAPWSRHKADLDAHRPFRCFRYALTMPDGTLLHVSVNGKPMFDESGGFRGYRGTTTNETAIVEARRRAEQAEELLHQAQKMEAIGQLTGGIAHDFNNLLTAVITTLDLFQRIYLVRVPEAQPLLESALRAAQRGAGLTKGLLAFARRQTLQPETIDVNELVGGMSELLRRSLGVNIAIEAVLGDGLWQNFVDPNQLESALLNLALNARDAMPHGGKLTIETSNTLLDDHAARHAEIGPGQYVAIAVSDIGIGMPEEVLARIFEPFFTTKPDGRGTGLGLSQVYGFVKQSGGHLKVYSEVGIGTTAKIYLPRAAAERGTETATRPPALAMRGGRETVLLVEDDDEVRLLTVQALRHLGYGVREAAEAATALTLLEQHPEIVMLFSDVGLPGADGRRLAEEAVRRKPGLKVLFTTAYASAAVVRHSILAPDVRLLSKPFTVEDLARKMREVLDG